MQHPGVSLFWFYTPFNLPQDRMCACLRVEQATHRFAEKDLVLLIVACSQSPNNTFVSDFPHKVDTNNNVKGNIGTEVWLLRDILRCKLPVRVELNPAHKLILPLPCSFSSYTQKFVWFHPTLQAKTPAATVWTSHYTKQNGNGKPMNIHCHNQEQNTGRKTTPREHDLNI